MPTASAQTHYPETQRQTRTQAPMHALSNNAANPTDTIADVPPPHPASTTLAAALQREAFTRNLLAPLAGLFNLLITPVVERLGPAPDMRVLPCEPRREARRERKPSDRPTAQRHSHRPAS
jgi:hypothetical protein